MSQVDIRRAADRQVTETDWLTSRHSFSYGTSYDPHNTSFGVLLAHNDDLLTPGTGFDEHPHRGLEIVTWVLAGTLLHGDASGRVEELSAGQVQVFGAGRGSTHSEYAGALEHGPARTRYVQMWIAPDPGAGTEPAYQRGQISDEADRLDRVVSSDGDAPLTIRRPGTAFSAGTLSSGSAVELPAAPYLHLFVANGTVTLSGLDPVRLAAGDAARITGAAGLTVTAESAATVGVWEMTDSLLG